MKADEPTAKKRLHHHVQHHVKRHATKFKLSFSRLWPLWALLIFTTELALIAAAWTHFFGGLKNPPLQARSDNYVITILSSRVSNGDETFRPGTGYRYVILNVKVENDSGEAAWVAPVVQTYVKDKAGTHYDLAPATLTEPFTAGIIKPSQSSQGELSYVVPEHSDVRAFCFTEAPVSQETVCLPLKL